MRTRGLSPKLYPAVAAFVIGVVLVLLGHDDAGLTIAVTGFTGLGVGAALPPGDVVPKPPKEGK